MKNSLKLILLFIVLLVACKDKQEINLSYTNAEGEVPTLGSLTFTFDQNVAPDSIIQQWLDKDNYVEFSPKIKGQFKWTATNELTFSPANYLPPATNFKATLNNSITDVNPKFSSVTAKEINFYTARLNLNSSEAYWFLDESNATQAMVELEFNHKVDAKEIANALKIEKDGEKMDFELQSVGETYYVKCKFKNLSVKDEDYVFDIILNKGLLPVGGNNKTEVEIFDKVMLKSPYKIEISNVETDHNGETGTVTVSTSQAVKAEGLEKYIEIKPKVNFKVSTTEKSIVITSNDFDVTTTYELILKKGMVGVVGGKLNLDYSSDIAFGELEPSIGFENYKGKYLSSAGAKNVAVRIINVPKVSLKIYKVYESNILTSDNYYGYGYQEKDIVYEKEIKTTDLKKAGSSSILTLNFEDILKDYNGIYYIEIRSLDDYWVRDSKYLSLSDIGLIVKEGMNKMQVFANSIKTAQSLAGIKIKMYGKNNQLISETVTSSDGSASLSYKNENISGFQPALITAEKNGDFTAINLYDTEINTSRFEVGGYRDLPNGLQTFIYLERNIYRPGETVNFATVVRNQTWASPGKLPLKIEIVSPSGKKLKTFTKTLNEEGSVDANFSTLKESLTGVYSIFVYTSNNVLLASKNVMIEEFMPDRIKVNTAVNKEQYTINDQNIELSVTAQNLFGPPAANRNYEVELNYKTRYFSAKDYTNYDFYILNTNRYFESELRQGKTDASGQAKESFKLDETFENMGLLQADIFTTVFDETGRPVNRKNSVEIYTQDIFYGIGYFDYYLATNSEIKMPLIAVNKDGKSVNSKATIKVIKHEYQTVLNKSGSYFRYESNKIEKTLVSKEIAINGPTNFKFVPNISGEYEVRIYKPGEKDRYVSQYFYAYGYGNTYLSSFEVDNEGKVTMETDKEEYEVGDKAKILFNTPFQGKMLVTVEGKDVLDYYYVNTDKRSASLTIDITEAFLPNVYISATLIKPHQTTEFPLTVAHGFQSIGVKQEERKLDVAIEAVESSRSKTKQKIKVKTASNAYVSIAVVDEGILQVGGFKTPNPYDYFYQKRALQVNTYDIYPYLLPEISAASLTGGDMELDMGKRVNPFQNDRVKLVSYWSGLVKTNSFGNAEYEIDIPQFSGSLRIMAVAHKDKSFGSAEKNMTVADPIVISSTIPRFLSPGDTAYVSSTLSNTTKKGGNVKATISTSGALGIVEDKNATLSVDANSEGVAYFKVYAKNELGNGKITIKASAFGETFTEETDMSVRPAVPLVQSSNSGSVQGGKNITLNVDASKYLPQTVSYKLVVSKNPMVEYAKDLDYLVRYPYGCSEQTISAVFPQLYYRDIIKSMYNDNLKENINQNIITAMNKLKLRQIYNGGINTWDNCECESWWTTAYAAHFLIEAEKAGYNVDANFKDNILSYLKNRLKKKEVYAYRKVGGGEYKIAPKEVAYSLYVLALANKSDISMMNYYKSNTQLLSADSKFLLAAAYVLSGDKIKGNAIMPNTFNFDQTAKEFGGSFSSPTRDEAIALNVLLETDPQNKNIGIMTQHLSSQLKTNRYLSTQERVFSFLALGKVAKKANESSAVAEVRANGKLIGSVTDNTLKFGTNDLKDKKIEIATKGSGDIYYFWETEGVSKDGSFKEEDEHLKVRKTFYDRHGNTISGNSFKQNDLIVVGISVQTDYNTTVENVVITDILPAGFEIENSRITEVPGTEWIKDASYPDQLDIRDDRIMIFDDVRTYSNKPQKYYYVVRAVSPGVYKMGPVGAEAMYNGAYHSYNGGGLVKIIK